MRAYERFLKYIRVYTTSDDSSETIPSTQRQFDLGNKLAQEMKELGISNVRIDDKCYVYGEIPAAKGYEDAPGIGFIAHMDTAPDFSGEGVNPQIIENYDGSRVALGNSGLFLDPTDFPHLSSLKGRTLITTDGTTLLGGDDKAGIAEIMTLAEILLKEDIPHGKICIGFTPDEEIGRGADCFDIENFGADFAYTVDGGVENELEYENFNAAGAQVQIKGFPVHPGSSKNTLVNAVQVAVEFHNMLPAGETPRYTEEYEGFYHLCDLNGDIAQARMVYIIRDHDSHLVEARISTMKHIAKLLNEKYGAGTVTLTIKEQYRNMKEKIEPCMHLIENVKLAAQEAGLSPVTVPIRGGTDGARLSYMGLPCPNLGTGGYAAHGPCEHITVEGMDLVVEILKGIVKRYAEPVK